MNGYLANLARRGAGLAPVLAPRPPVRLPDTGEASGDMPEAALDPVPEAIVRGRLSILQPPLSQPPSQPSGEEGALSEVARWKPEPAPEERDLNSPGRQPRVQASKQTPSPAGAADSAHGMLPFQGSWNHQAPLPRADARGYSDLAPPELPPPATKPVAITLISQRLEGRLGEEGRGGEGPRVGRDSPSEQDRRRARLTPAPPGSRSSTGEVKPGQGDLPTSLHRPPSPVRERGPGGEASQRESLDHLVAMEPLATREERAGGSPSVPEPVLPAPLNLSGPAPEPAEPRIEVRIGRVELRAAPPATPPPSPAREERRGFEDYALARRYLRRRWY
jgi:hypothetical protein